MNAFQPSVSCLDKLGQIVAILEGMVREGAWLNNGLKGIVLDSEVRAWMARMRELERLPPEVSPEPFTDWVRTTIQPTPEMIADAGPPSNYVEEQLKKMVVMPDLVGYSLSAIHPTEGIICTYREAETPQKAADFCYDEFPQIEGYTNRTIKNTETSVEISLPDIPNLLGSLNEMLEHTGKSLPLDLGENNSVVDTAPRGLSLEDGEDD